MIPRIHLVIALAAVLGVGGCGSGNADAFVGEWTYAGTIAANCVGITIPDLPLDGATVTIVASDDEHLQVVVDTTCMVRFMVDGDTATAAGGQTCMLNIPTVGLQSITITSWTLTLADGVITSQFSGGLLVCAPTGTGTLTKVPAGS
jgi:hypothetical protein